MTTSCQSFQLPERATLGGSPPTDHVDLAFKPRVMFMTGCGVPTADLGTTFHSNAWGGFGWSIDPAIGNECSSVGSGGYQSGHVPGEGYISDSIFAGIYENTNLREKSIDLVSLDCDEAEGHATSGYTYTTGVALQTGVVATLALGGDNISFATGSFSWPGGAGDVVTTGLGFEPQLVMFVWSKMDTYNRGYVFGDTNGSSFGFGASDGTDSFAIYTGSDGGTGSGDSIHQTDACIICHDYTSVIAKGVLSATGFDTFTVTFDGDDTGEPNSVPPRLIGWIALADSEGGFKVGNETVPVSTGNVSYSCGFEPDQVITAHGNATSANTVVYGGSWGIGMFDDTLQMAFLNGENLVPFPQYGARLCNTTALEFGTNVSTTIDGQAERVSIGNGEDGFTLNFTNTVVSGKPWSWIAMKTTGSNFAGVCGPLVPVDVGPIVSMYRNFAQNQP